MVTIFPVRVYFEAIIVGPLIQLDGGEVMGFMVGPIGLGVVAFLLLPPPKKKNKRREKSKGACSELLGIIGLLKSKGIGVAYS